MYINIMKLGTINFKKFLENTQGKVRGIVITDAKYRTYAADYRWEEDTNGGLIVYRLDGTGEKVHLKSVVELDESLVSFFGLYSGDGSKGSANLNDIGIIIPTISFSQTEPNLIKFAVEQFRIIFSNSIRFTFSLGEDSAYFMAGEGKKLLNKHYKGSIPNTPPLNQSKPNLNEKDKEYLKEKRDPDLGNNEDNLAFYYFHKSAMKSILETVKRDELRKVGVALNIHDKVQASLRRPFKKGARTLGGSSRAD
jgi:hypothetical protein